MITILIYSKASHSWTSTQIELNKTGASFKTCIWSTTFARLSDWWIERWSLLFVRFINVYVIPIRFRTIAKATQKLFLNTENTRVIFRIFFVNIAFVIYYFVFVFYRNYTKLREGEQLPFSWIIIILETTVIILVE